MMVSTEIFVVLAVAMAAGVNGMAPQKIVNGTSTVIGEIPYHASLRVNGKHYCSGAIVSPRHIVTSAHCIAGISENPTVVVGTVSSTDGINRPIKKMQPHPRYRTGHASSPFDIGIITLSNNIVFNYKQRNITLPTKEAPIGYLATASGWGYVNASDPTISPILNKIKLPLIADRQCQEMYGSGIHIWPNLQICTYGGRGSGICTVDGGGPLVYDNELIGIASFGIPCAVGYPDVFTNVYDAIPWIESIVK